MYSLSGKAADRQQTVPSWMFQRSADRLVGTAPIASMAALVTLAELLKAVAAPKNSATRSPDSAQHRAPMIPIGDKPMPHRPQVPRQIDLFASAPEMPDLQPPPWQSLLPEVRQSLTELMARQILDHVAAEGEASEREVRHDA